MSKIIAITAATFTSVLAKLVTADNSMASRIQELIMFGLHHYNEHNDSVFLTQLMNAGFKSVRTEAIKVYIQDHTNLVLRKDGDEGAVKFKIDRMSTNERYTEPSKTWTEYSGVGQAMPIDADSIIKRAINTLSRAIAGEGKKALKEGTKEHAILCLANLKKCAVASGIDLDNASHDAVAKAA